MPDDITMAVEDEGPDIANPEPAIAEPDPAPEPEPTPEPEPEPDSFGWLNEPPPQPQYPDVPPRYPDYPQQQPPQQPQYQQPQQPGGFDVNALVQDPRYMDQYMDQRLDRGIREKLVQTVGPLAANAIEQQRRLEGFMQTQARVGEMQLKGALDEAKRDIYNKSNAFRASPGVRKQVESHLKERYHAAVDAARQGDFTELHMLQSPRYHGAVLALAKYFENYQEAGEAPPVGKAVVETPKPRATPEDNLNIPADMMEAARRMGPAAVERLKESYKEYGDMIEFV